MEHVIHVQNLTKIYGKLIAVDHINFDVHKGEIFGFLGPNGAGKTTTLRMLTGIIKPNQGKADILGFNIQKEPLKAKQNIGVVPETSNAYVDLSAWQNMMLMSELYGIPKKEAERRSKSLLERLNLYDRRNDKVKGFSKGMKQRLILCMALVNDPQIIFLDEPTSGLDVHSSLLIRDILQEFPDHNKTIFLTTHNMDEANYLCDRVAIINKGKIAAIDRPGNLKNTIKKLKSIEVSFDKTVNIQKLSTIPNINEVRKEGDKFIIDTDNINDLIHSVTNFAQQENLKIITLNTRDPSLEEVFLKITGET
ncbi:MAG: ATP-binding cassette domain-containing protein [Euryarchaeota archaeon]|jgi:ABC-2 type transport system ATP-binding protein|nr:ATP-binding cassette domain-containing protein [Euryarchaeota archaeon]HHT18310.1 ATP-binding cassette domain-containing protein [Methanobacterium sp.]